MWQVSLFSFQETFYNCWCISPGTLLPLPSWNLSITTANSVVWRFNLLINDGRIVWQGKFLFLRIPRVGICNYVSLQRATLSSSPWPFSKHHCGQILNNNYCYSHWFALLLHFIKWKPFVPLWASLQKDIRLIVSMLFSIVLVSWR